MASMDQVGPDWHFGPDAPRRHAIRGTPRGANGRFHIRLRSDAGCGRCFGTALCAYMVQLVSNKSEAETQSSFKVLQNKYPTVLGIRTALIRRVELGDRGTYYRAHVGPFANADQANVLCDRLKSAGGQCLVHKN